MSDQDLQHEQAVDEAEPASRAPRGSLLQQAKDLGARLVPLPEDSWVHRPPIQDQADPEATETSDDPGDVDGWDSTPSEAADSSGSTSPAAVRGWRKGSALFYGKLVKTLLAAASGIANLSLRQDEDDIAWLMAREEVDGIGEPLGRIASRRAPLPVGEGTASDLGDALEAGVALTSYVIRNLQIRAERKRGPQAMNPMDQGEQAA